MSRSSAMGRLDNRSLCYSGVWGTASSSLTAGPIYIRFRAVHFDHEVARIFQAAGVMADVAQVTESADTYQWRNADGQMLLEIDSRGMGPSGWPVAHLFAQPELERVMDKHVKAQPNVEVRQGWSAQRLHGNRRRR